MTTLEIIDNVKERGWTFRQRFKGKSNKILLIFSKRSAEDYGERNCVNFYALKIDHANSYSDIYFKYAITASALATQKIADIVGDPEAYIINSGLFRFKKLLKDSDEVRKFPDLLLSSDSSESEYAIDLLQGLDIEINRVRFEVLDFLRRNKYLGRESLNLIEIADVICSDQTIVDTVYRDFEENGLIKGAYGNKGVKITVEGEKYLEKIKNEQMGINFGSEGTHKW